MLVTAFVQSCIEQTSVWEQVKDLFTLLGMSSCLLSSSILKIGNCNRFSMLSALATVGVLLLLS